MRLGLVGVNISNSLMPAFFREAQSELGIELTYELLEVSDVDEFDLREYLTQCVRAGFHGINITYPFKEEAASIAQIDDLSIRALGAVNTLVFVSKSEETFSQGFNTDFSGFIARWKMQESPATPGVVAMIGTGGVGRACAYAIATLGATEIRLFDADVEKVRRLSGELEHAFPSIAVRQSPSSSEALYGASGIMNCTPVGMYSFPGIPVDPAKIVQQEWVFDAVYSPLETHFIATARSAGLQVMSGFELFLGQAFDALSIYTGIDVSHNQKLKIEAKMRQLILERE